MGDTKLQFWQRHTFLIITGASQGIGKNLAIAFSRLIKPDSTILLLARSLAKLEETKNEILSNHPTLNVKVISADLSKPNIEQYDNIFKLLAAEKNDFDLNLFVHNAATTICDVPAAKMDDLNTWNEYMTLNLYSVTLLTSAFLKYFQNGERCLVNITSLAAVQPFKGSGFYCIGKASREMYFRCLAEENPTLNILNYSPGPIKTDMLLQIAAESCFAELKTQFENMIKEDKTVKMDDTIKKLIGILAQRCYTSGDRLDYYDR